MIIGNQRCIGEVLSKVDCHLAQWVNNQEKVPVVTVVNHTATALSTDVAAYFEKRHDNVVRDIENLRSSLPSDRLLDFEETVVTRINPSGGLPIKSKAYRMTRDGFVLLVMGWTGEKALQFKLAWLDAFNRMEAQLKGTLPPTLTPAQQRGIQVAIAQRAGKNQLLYHALYRELKNHFNVASYKQIPFDGYETAIAIINDADLGKVTEVAQTSAISSSSVQSDAIFNVLATQWDNMAKVMQNSAEVLRYLGCQKRAEPKPAIAQAKPKLQKHDEPDETSVSKKEESAEDEIQYDLNLQFSTEKRTQHMSMAISPTLADKFKKFAKLQKLSVNEAVNRALERFLERA